ncbi:MAG TPA: hypothetical protein VFS27_05315 [Blastocatellia bacterium]|jgi:hypothetical protein|nr:hypothetical protein [Blastocatellia bacterium]
MKKDDYMNLDERRSGLPEDRELNRLLASWQAPESPGELDQRAIESYRGHIHGKRFWRGGFWRRWLAGSIRIPVPIAAAAVLLLCATSFLAARKATSISIESAPAVGVTKFVEVPVTTEKVVTRVVYKNTGAQKAQERPAPISIPPRIDLAEFRPVSEIKIIVSHGGNDED